MISIITALYKGISAASLDKDYLKGIYYLLESIAGMIFMLLICIIGLLIK